MIMRRWIRVTWAAAPRPAPAVDGVACSPLAAPIARLRAPAAIPVRTRCQSRGFWTQARAQSLIAVDLA